MTETEKQDKFIIPEKAEIKVYDSGPYTGPRILKGPKLVIGPAVIDNRRIKVIP